LIHVAVLDDDADFRAYMEDFLAGEGRYRVSAYATPDALFTGATLELPDIVLLDMQMGEARGGDVLEQLLARYPGLCVIVVTGYPSLEDMRATFKLKVFDYVAKPFALQQMRQVLANAVESFALGRSQQDQLRERLGQRIRLLRAEREWSLKDLAQSARLSVSQISSIERGANLPSMESLLSISRAFGKHPSELLASIDF
jgi:DNA-binding NtrC family response regulator